VKEKIIYVERKADSNGIERIYGYTIEGQKYFLNIEYVIAEYKRRGLKGFERCV
jgi:hypothetical protein